LSRIGRDGPRRKCAREADPAGRACRQAGSPIPGAATARSSSPTAVQLPLLAPGRRSLRSAPGRRVRQLHVPRARLPCNRPSSGQLVAWRGDGPRCQPNDVQESTSNGPGAVCIRTIVAGGSCVYYWPGWAVPPARLHVGSRAGAAGRRLRRTAQCRHPGPPIAAARVDYIWPDGGRRRVSEAAIDRQWSSTAVQSPSSVSAEGFPGSGHPASMRRLTAPRARLPCNRRSSRLPLLAG
jgi:hypothetical protein